MCLSIISEKLCKIVDCVKTLLIGFEHVCHITAAMSFLFNKTASRNVSGNRLLLCIAAIKFPTVGICRPVHAVHALHFFPHRRQQVSIPILEKQSPENTKQVFQISYMRISCLVNMNNTELCKIRANTCTYS